MPDGRHYKNPPPIPYKSCETGARYGYNDKGVWVRLPDKPSVADVLKEHWLTGIHCDHEAKTDVATCYCSVWRSKPMPSVGAAVDEWIKHVTSQL